MSVIYSRLQSCQSRAQEDLFVTDNKGNVVHQENKDLHWMTMIQNKGSEIIRAIAL